MDLVNVEKIGKGYFVFDHNGESLIGYRNKKNAEDFATGHACFIYGEAERYNERRDSALAYLASRANRLPYVSPQLELF